MGMSRLLGTFFGIPEGIREKIHRNSIEIPEGIRNLCQKSGAGAARDGLPILWTSCVVASARATGHRSGLAFQNPRRRLSAVSVPQAWPSSGFLMDLHGY